MFVGHYSAGLLASRVEPTINLGILFLAAQATDLLWAMLVLLHIEHMDIVLGFTASNPFDFDHMPYSHSLAGAFLLSLLIFTFARMWFPRKAAMVLAAVVFSHWFLDLLVHRPDLTFLGYGQPVGFALWDHPLVGICLEIGPFLVGCWLYLQYSAHHNFIGRYGFVALTTVMIVVHLVVFFGPALPSAAAVTGLALFSYIAYAAAAGWLDTLRSLPPPTITN